MSDWPFVIQERVRFRDVDSFGHINNAVYSTYLEQARLDVLGGLGSVILARVEIDFRAELSRRGRRGALALRADRDEERRARARDPAPAAGSPRRRRACSSASTTSGA